jgi:hypothetical protein
MATGAGDEYRKEQALPSVFKHTLLDKYMPQFAGMTDSAARERQVCLSRWLRRPWTVRGWNTGIG